MKFSKIIFASDFKGIGLRKKLLEYATGLNLCIEDIGIFEGSPLDFVDITKQLALKLTSSNICGLLICNDGHGVTMAANKYNYIRAALCGSKKDAEAVRKKLNANVLCLGSKNLPIDQAKSCLDIFISTSFEPTKYKKAIEKLKTVATIHSDQGVNLIVRGIITCNDHILLSTTTQHNKEFAKDLYFLPGGHVDYNEPATSALEREILEEMGLQAKELKFMGALECSWNKKGSLYHEINLIYLVSIPNLSLNAPPQSSEPFIKFVWCPLSAISNYHILPEQLGIMLQEMDVNVDIRCFYSQMVQQIS
ncbi:MAG: RpiB/LacA/LacB family sugar-phosphate isomerase [Simkaniaceae bacterium]|nr:RpiB/LacA/LacB family sugar-phosphate isomerase [Simkaniaceae bacterium]